MGGDGGVIATQRKFVRGAKNDEKEDGKNVKQNQIIRSTTCALSAEPLQEPIVSCELGNLFNKAAILTALLDKSLQVNPAFSYIRGRKDLQTCKFTANPDQSKKGSAPFMCPVTKLEMNGQLPFVIVWPTGHVLSEKAVREIGSAGLQAEYGPFSPADLVKLCPLEEEQPAQIEQMISRRALRDGRGSGAKRTHSDTKPVGLAPTSTATENQTEEARTEPKRVKKTITAAAVSGPLPVAAITAAATTTNSNSASVSNLRASASVVRSAAAAVAGQQSGQVFQKLFHSEQQQGKMSDRDLFMSVAGLRYSI
eukprot:gene25090-33604_t